MTTTSEQSKTRSRPASLLAGKYLTFCLGAESYGLPVVKVREIIRFVSPTHVPQMPPHVEGVINLRGKIIPVLNLRRKFGLAPTTATERTCTVVVKVASDHKTGGLIGLVVDGVEEVAQISTLDLEATPDFGPQADTHHILGMAKVKGVIKTLLDLDRIVSTETLAATSLQIEPAA